MILDAKSQVCKSGQNQASKSTEKSVEKLTSKIAENDARYWVLLASNYGANGSNGFSPIDFSVKNSQKHPKLDPNLPQNLSQKPSVNLVQESAWSDTEKAKYDPISKEVTILSTGEIINPVYHRSDALIRKYDLQFKAREILRTKSGKVDRTTQCLRSMIPTAESVDYYRSVEFGTTHEKGLIVCGSVWKCSVCNSKISEQRAYEIRTVTNNHIAMGGSVALLSFTVPHALGDDLSWILKQLQKAFNRTWTSESVKRLKIDINMVGYVRSLETTYGFSNGHHPHFHMLVYYFNHLNVSEAETLVYIKDELFPVWKNRCERLGLGTPTYRRGLDVRGGMSASDYLVNFGKEQKWGLDKELTKGNSKTCNLEDRYTPFDFLRSYLDSGDKRMPALFLEYAAAFHGKKFVTWSRGFKEQNGIDDSIEKDKQIAESVDELSMLIGRMGRELWNKVIYHEKRATVKILVEKGFQVALDYVNSLKEPKYRRN